MSVPMWLAASVLYTIIGNVAISAPALTWRTPLGCACHAVAGFAWWMGRRAGIGYLDGAVILDSAGLLSAVGIGLATTGERPTARGWIGIALAIAAVLVGGK